MRRSGSPRSARVGRCGPRTSPLSTFANSLQLAGLPDPDLFIRTGGEKRISNFLLWNLAYTELYFCDALWPDFDAAGFQQAVDFFTARQRRYGLTAAQAGGVT